MEPIRENADAGEELFGTPGNDTIYGYGGDDTLQGSPGYDILDGGPGADTFVFDDIIGGERLNNDFHIVTTLEGHNVIKNFDEASDNIPSVKDAVMDSIASNSSRTEKPDPNQNTQDPPIQSIGVDQKNPSKNVIFKKSDKGDIKAESSISSALDDEIKDLKLTGNKDINGIGNALNNKIEGNNGKNLLIANAGNDIINGYEEEDILIGGNGKDKLKGGDDDDFLDGGSGKDTLSGNRGKDILNGGSGRDTLSGGFGADIFVFSTENDGVDTIKDFNGEVGDKIHIYAEGFDIEQDEYDRFKFDNSSNQLLFDQNEINGKPSFKAFVTLQPDANFNINDDIIIV